MRKLFWCGAAGLVAFAVAVYFVADHATKHPNSYWGRCISSAASLGLYANPFVPVTVAGKVIKETGHQAIVGAGNAVAAQDDVNAEFGVPPVLNEGNFEVNHAIPLEDVLPIEPITVEPMRPDPAPDEGENWVFDGQAIRSFFSNETEEPRVGATEESEPFNEDELEPEALPMPYADEACQPQACPVSPPSCENWFWKLLRVGGLIREMPVADDDAELAPMPTPCDEETQEQGTENENREQSPDCQENPAYHHHYHGCPYMGGCPYPHSRAVPIITPIEPQPASEPAPAKKKIKEKKPATETSNGIKKVFWYNLDEESGQSGIDTMEFRPSDDPREWPGNAPF